MIANFRSQLLLLGVLLLALPACRQADPDPMRFERAILGFEAQDLSSSPPGSPILFIGSSSIGGWETDRFFPGLPVVNRGFGGSQISDINHYFERVVLPYRPRAIVFYAGENDIHAGKHPEQVARDFRRFVTRVQADLKDTRVLFLSMKPSPSRWHLWPRMQAGNRQIQRYSETSPLVVYVDAATPLLGPDGSPDPALFVDDGLHMTPAGYQRWSAVLTPFLQRVMEDGAG